MNANEIADSIDKYLDSILEEAIHPIEDVLNEAITMLRQLQDEINSLRNNGYKTHYELLRLEFINQQAEIDNLTSIKYVNGVTISKLYAEIEALKVKAHEWYLIAMEKAQEK